MGRQFFIETAHEILVLTFLGISIQWRLMLRCWHAQRGETTRILHWITTVIGLIVMLNLLGIEIIKSAIIQSPMDWFNTLWLLVAEIAASLTIVLAFIEYYIRLRKSRRAAEN